MSNLITLLHDEMHLYTGRFVNVKIRWLLLAWEHGKPTTAASRINVGRRPIKHRQHIVCSSGNIFRPQIQNDQLEMSCMIVNKCRYDVYIIYYAYYKSLNKAKNTEWYSSQSSSTISLVLRRYPMIHMTFSIYSNPTLSPTKSPSRTSRVT